MRSTGDSMMFFHKTLFAMLAGASATVVAACSNDNQEAATTKRAEAACEHINSVCATTQGFQTQDCSSSQANYEKLNGSEKTQADLMIPCVMAAKSCSPALDCVRPPPTGNANDSTARTKDKETPAHDPEDACEHINVVCANEEGFRNQDCSTSNAQYEKLSDADKEIADAIVPCIMGSKTCKSAFQCLDFK